MEPQLLASHSPDLLRPEVFSPIKNRKFLKAKPWGGIWTSTFHQLGSDWVRYCFQDKDARKLGIHWHIIYPHDNARIYEIDSLEDLQVLLKTWGIPKPSHVYQVIAETETGDVDCHNQEFTEPSEYIDFEKAALDFDGIHLTAKGEKDTRCAFPQNLYGWDVESTLWLNWAFQVVSYLGIVELS